MKHASNPRRLRNRGNGKRHPSARNQTFESNGPDGKIRGSAQQVLERYLVLARDASASGDHISAESYLQHAEHYFRILHASDNYQNDRSRDRLRVDGVGSSESNGQDDGEDNGASADDPLSPSENADPNVH